MSKNAFRVALVVLVLGVAVFSAVGYARQWPGFGRLVSILLPTGPAQNVGHVVLFLVVGILLLALIPPLRKRFLLYIGLMALVAFSQELLEVSLRSPRFSAGDLFDVVFDITGACLGYLVFTLGSQLRARLRTAPDNPK